jgi:anti-anti-sigma factor
MPTTLSTTENVTRINLSGEFDFSSQDELKQVFENALNTTASEIQLDLQKTNFIDSSVIRLFLKLLDTARKNKKSLSLIHCNERIYEIFAIGGFNQIFDIR